MRSSLASLMADGLKSSAVGRAKSVPPTGFEGEIAVAAQVFADGLAVMWAARRDAATARPSDPASRRALLDSITNRAGILTARTTASAAQPGTAGGFAQAGASIHDLARRVRSAQTLAPHPANRRTAELRASGSAA
ncbi:hypothetical protein MKK84_02665 [Methylobacterium sp. E-065]|uniref:hypothetical protein n=1 Tax=Methylobacterium sp. E-065 TaxID=2836583 RepID=UPI001FBBF420|nr:hypothetical protein [Methylobacterium sp. E-065]MCJ2016338.1 hypothetical protein [Methylobacterium sp. E-065]